jgi:hypothetical protein
MVPTYVLDFTLDFALDFWPNLFQKGCILAQPFKKRLCFCRTFSKKVLRWGTVVAYSQSLKAPASITVRSQNI